MIAREILSQLGGNKFIAMTGAKNLMDCGDGLMFTLPRNSEKVTKVRVRFQKAHDLYIAEFYKGRGLDIRLSFSIPMVDCETLPRVIQSHTGLYTSL